METQEIQEIVNTAITALQDNDDFLLKQDISEWAISHKLAVYLDDKFPDCNVDCEYNGYAKADNNKKYIMILRHRLSKLGKLKDSDGDEKTLKRSVYPDIIVHQRGKEYNLLILEVKKEIQTISNLKLLDRHGLSIVAINLQRFLYKNMFLELKKKK